VRNSGSRSVETLERPAWFRSHDPEYTDGGQLRDFVHVADTVSVMRWFA